ncbi:hypothetical protein [Pseudoduganella chitinolytica]|uniref:Uncharacterized protein n=1 Tax=Pseudoduganella chitinolytica TaxID=34070 RepID=A0ABY8BIH0_9BURK|nr:hypothetical protein [Pseudoduganella chitinolytica]WEF35776.1 hypothetical protein PX653_13830 [Pseudoduganella chitinolytica]
MRQAIYAVVAATLSLPTLSALADERGNATPPFTITSASDARTVMRGLPEEAVTERFEALPSSGAVVAYVGLADGDVGGVVFQDGRLAGTLNRAQADAFYACRGYTTARWHYWAQDASLWVESLLRVAQPASTVDLVFSGTSTSRSLRAVFDNPAIGQVQALVEMGTNPLKVVRALSKAHRAQRQREADEHLGRELGKLVPGDSEKRLAEVAPPQDVAFVERGLVLAYPKHSLDFVVSEGRIQALQQPSFLQLVRAKPALFYMPDIAWSNCTPELWSEALPVQATTTGG